MDFRTKPNSRQQGRSCNVSHGLSLTVTPQHFYNTLLVIEDKCGMWNETTQVRSNQQADHWGPYGRLATTLTFDL